MRSSTLPNTPRPVNHVYQCNTDRRRPHAAAAATAVEITQPPLTVRTNQFHSDHIADFPAPHFPANHLYLLLFANSRYLLQISVLPIPIAWLWKWETLENGYLGYVFLEIVGLTLN